MGMWRERSKGGGWGEMVRRKEEGRMGEGAVHN